MDGQFIREQFEKIKSQIQKYSPNAKLVAVTKKQPIEKMEYLYGLGHNVFAENYVQEFLEKKNKLSNLNIEWHLIGPLQSNKVSKVVGQVDYIHSVDTLELATKIDNVAKTLGIKQKVLLQINVANEDSKSGLTIDLFMRYKKQFFDLKNLLICGFMTMPPLANSSEDSKKYFKTLKEIQLQTKCEYDSVSELSMGTTQDYVVALQEGSTMIRIGEALLGTRS